MGECWLSTRSGSEVTDARSVELSGNAGISCFFSKNTLSIVYRFILRNLELTETIKVLRDMKTAPIAGVRRMP